MNPHIHRLYMRVNIKNNAAFVLFVQQFSKNMLCSDLIPPFMIAIENTTRITHRMIGCVCMYICVVALHYILCPYTIVAVVASKSFHSWFHNALTTSLRSVVSYIIYYDFILPAVDLHFLPVSFSFSPSVDTLLQCLNFSIWMCFHLYCAGSEEKKNCRLIWKCFFFLC